MSSKRIPMVLHLHPQKLSRAWPSRIVRPSDARDLGTLMYAAFRRTVDDEGETFADAVREVEKTLAGGYGRLLPNCSFVIEQGDSLASACLTSWYEPSAAPFVVFTMTHPTSKGKGMARFLLTKSINELVSQGHPRLELLVTDGNKPAQKLYSSLGFRDMVLP